MKAMPTWSRVDLESDLDDIEDQEDAEDLCGQNVVLLQFLMCYVRCSTSSVTFEFVARASTTSVKLLLGTRNSTVKAQPLVRHTA